MRNRLSGASSASRSSTLIGVTCETTSVRPGYAATTSSRRGGTRRAAANDSPPGGAASGEENQLAQASGNRSPTSGTSALPTRRSPPRRAAVHHPPTCRVRRRSASAVCRARSSGELDDRGDRSGRERAASAAACRTPSSVSGRSLRPENRRSTECSVAPCRTQDQPRRGPVRRRPAAVSAAPPCLPRRCGGPSRRPRRPIHRLVGQPVGIACSARAESTRSHRRRTAAQRVRLARQHAQRSVLDLPVARHLLDDELGVHPHRDRRCAELGGGPQPGDQAAVLGHVVGGDADRLGALGQHAPVVASQHDRAVAGRPGLPRDPPSASTIDPRRGTLTARTPACAPGCAGSCRSARTSPARRRAPRPARCRTARCGSPRSAAAAAWPRRRHRCARARARRARAGRRDLGGDRLALGGALLDRLVDLGERRVARGAPASARSAASASRRRGQRGRARLDRSRAVP